MYDYVIVGAGSAGCVLAARLGGDRDARVAVIEAGPPDSEPVIHMPLAFRQLWESRFDWGLWSEREPGLGDWDSQGSRVACGRSSDEGWRDSRHAYDIARLGSDHATRGGNRD